ncbi:hypothetical protein FAGAP_8606, partial [Fusarium agapanthi]
MSVTDPFVEFEKNLNCRIAKTGAEWKREKDSLASSLEQFYEEKCLKEPSKFPKMALQVMQAFKKKALSSLEDLLKFVYATQRSQDEDSKDQLKVLVYSMECHFQSYTSRNDGEERHLRQRLLVMEKSRPPNPASNPEQKPEKPIPKRRTSVYKRVGSAGKAFERAKVAERIIGSQQANWHPKPSRHSCRRQNAIRMEKTLDDLNENSAISRKRGLYNRSQTYGNPKGPARRTSMTASRPPTATRPKKRYTARSLWQELNDSELQSEEPEDVPDKKHAKPPFKQEAVAAQGYRHPRIGEELLIDDAFVLGQQLNEEFSTTSSLADAEDSDSEDTEVEEMVEEGKVQQKRDLQEKPQSGPDGTIMPSPKKWQSSLKEENTPQKDSDDEKEAVSEDKKRDGPAGDMSSNGTGECSDMPEASQEANTPAPGNSDGGDDPDPDPTKGATADIALSHLSTKTSGIFQFFKLGLRVLILLVKLFVVKQVWVWCLAIVFVYQLTSWSFRRLIRRRNVDNDGKALKFPTPPPYVEVVAFNLVFFL